MKLRQGVIISAVIWLIIGLLCAAYFLNSAFYTNKNTNTFGYLQAISIFNATVFISLSCVALYGFLVFFFFGKSIKLFRIYSYATWFISVFSVTVVAIVTTSAIMISKHDFSNVCAQELVSDPNYMANAMELYKGCSDKANNDFLKSIIEYVMIISANVYFSIVIQFYIKQYIVKERRKSRKVARRELIEKKHSYNIGKNSRVDTDDPIEQSEPQEIVIKVNNTYDDD